ncbi:MAG: fluoride efflux transporter CrcB [Clostridia bacterium]|nr:fluoride efflux transporter CrcB [Clostridia bacterium]
MRKYLLIGMGGMLGAMSRYFIMGIHLTDQSGLFPINTFLTNITGSLILAFLLFGAFECWKINEDLRLGIGTGFLGAYTTFSTLCKETDTLISHGNHLYAFTYVFLSVVLGLAAAYLGIILAKKLSAKFKRKEIEIEAAEEME